MYFMIPVNSIWGKPKFLVEVFVCTLTAESKDGTRKTLNPLAGMLNPVLVKSEGYIFYCWHKKSLSNLSECNANKIGKSSKS